jgi:hypothetical protein
MPREGAIIFRDSAKKLDVLRRERGKCGHVGQYRAAPWVALSQRARRQERGHCACFALMRAKTKNSKKFSKLQPQLPARTTPP